MRTGPDWLGQFFVRMRLAQLNEIENVVAALPEQTQFQFIPKLETVRLRFSRDCKCEAALGPGWDVAPYLCDMTNVMIDQPGA